VALQVLVVAAGIATLVAVASLLASIDRTARVHPRTL